MLSTKHNILYTDILVSFLSISMLQCIHSAAYIEVLSMVYVFGSQVIYYQHIPGKENAAPLILLHGNGEDHHIFDTLCDSLGEDFDIYAPDSRGHGLSACPKELHYQDMADDLYRFITELDIRKPLIVGFSDGGITALIFASTYSQLCSGIICCGANTCPKGLTGQERMAIKKAMKRKLSSHGSSDTDIDTVSSQVFAASGALERLMLTEPDISEKMLGQISVPVLVLSGENDLVKKSDTMKIFSSIQKSQLRILPGEDHGSYVIGSDRLSSFIRDFWAIFTD